MGCDVTYSAMPESPCRGRAARGIDVDMNAISDTVQTLAAVALFAAGPTTIRGVAHIRHKETDRIGDLARELRKFGAIVEELARRPANHAATRTNPKRQRGTTSPSARGQWPPSHRNLQRPPHGHEPGPHWPRPAGHHHSQSRLHGEDVSAIF